MNIVTTKFYKSPPRPFPHKQNQPAPMGTHNSIRFLFIALLSLHSIHLSAAAVKASYWFPGSEFPVSSINSALFTHLFCAFADLDPASNQVTISSSNAAAFSTFTSTVQQKNPSVVTLLSIGGGGANSAAFASMASQPASRASFISSSIRLARANGFRGLDLDWEYPASNSDMANLGSLLSEWRAAVKAESPSSPLLLTAAVYVSSSLNSLTYPVPSISSSLDWINVMAYDFYAPTWKLVTSAHAALYDPAGGVSTSGGIAAWIAAGLAGQKIVMGMPFYGYAWKLSNPANHGLGAAATGPATGSGIASDGSIAFNGIKSSAWAGGSGVTTVYDPTVVMNYCYAGSTWIGYDDTATVAAKVTYAKQKGLLGYFAWSVSADANWLLSTQASSTWG